MTSCIYVILLFKKFDLTVYYYDSVSQNIFILLFMTWHVPTVDTVSEL